MGAAAPIEIPQFRSTEEAMAFGADMNAAQYDAAQQERGELQIRFRDELNLQTRVTLACRIQLLREACEPYEATLAEVSGS